MLSYPEYRATAIEVEGVAHAPANSGHHALLEVLAAIPGQAPDGTFIDSTVLDEYEVSERDAIVAEERASAI